MARNIKRTPILAENSALVRFDIRDANYQPSSNFQQTVGFSQYCHGIMHVLQNLIDKYSIKRAGGISRILKLAAEDIQP